jgi:hypothetical protein
LDLSNNGRIVQLLNPTASQDAATKSYVDSAETRATAVGSAAQTTANTAVTNAATAQTTANTAVTNAATAQTTANTAVTNAAAAQTTASAAVTSAANINTAITAGTATASAQYLYPNKGSGAAIATSPNSNTSHEWRLYVTAGGNVGIGTTTAAAPLHVSGSSSQLINGTRRYFDKYGSTTNAGTNTSGGFDTGISNASNSDVTNVSIMCSGSIWSQGSHVWITSDQRIKTNIVNLNADKMINVFRSLRPISFDFIDPMKNYGKKHFGFIAQEVNEILPEGISLNSDVIPNNMMKANIAKPSETDETPCFTLKPDDADITLQYLLLTTDTPLIFDISNSYSSANTYKFKIYGGDKWTKEHDIYIRSDYNVIDDKYTYVIGLKKEAYDVVITESTLFVYGQYVYDLHILEHDTIYTVATAALQEVDRQQQADKARIAELESTVATQQSLINEILERLKALEKA